HDERWQRVLRSGGSTVLRAPPRSARNLGAVPVPECSSEHLVPASPVLEHDFAQQADRWRAVPQHLVMEFLQRITRALLALEIAAHFQNLQFAQSIKKVTRIERAAKGFLPRRLMLVIAVLLEKPG